MYAVIMAGGGGTRLWPLSRPGRPKPFLRLLGEETLLQGTARRISRLVGPEDVYVVTDRRYAALVAEQLPDVPAANILGEPEGRNTAAAVALAAEAIDRPGGEVMVVLPADHQVRDEAGFCDALAAAAELARAGRFVTLGVSPTGPETGYGYAVAASPAAVVAGHRTYPVQRFVEKPDAVHAAELIATGLASWNAGIFAWTRATIRDGLARHAPEIAGPIRAICASDASVNDIEADLAAAYPSIRATSIDYAVMEPASVEGAVSVVPMDVGWSDLGSWSALRDAWLERQGADGAIGLGNRHDVGSTRTLVLAGDRLVVTIGLDDVVVVDTPDALLVCAADRSQDVRAVSDAWTRGDLATAGPGAGTATAEDGHQPDTTRRDGPRLGSPEMREPPAPAREDRS